MQSFSSAKSQSAWKAFTWPVRAMCWKFLKCIGMDVVYTAQVREEAIDMARPDIISLREEILQLLTGLKCLGIYFVFLSSLYLVASLLQWKTLSVDSFSTIKHKENWPDDYIQELYQYSKEIEEVKVVHAVSLLAIASFICYMVAKKKLLSVR